MVKGVCPFLGTVSCLLLGTYIDDFVRGENSNSPALESLAGLFFFVLSFILSLWASFVPPVREFLLGGTTAIGILVVILTLSFGSLYLLGEVVDTILHPELLVKKQEISYALS